MWHGKLAFSHHGTDPTDPYTPYVSWQTWFSHPHSIVMLWAFLSVSAIDFFIDPVMPRLHPISSNLKPRSVSSRAFSKTKNTLIPYRLKHSPWHSKGQEKPACPFLASEVGCRFEPFRRGNCALYGFCFLPPHSTCDAIQRSMWCQHM